MKFYECLVKKMKFYYLHVNEDPPPIDGKVNETIEIHNYNEDKWIIHRNFIIIPMQNK